MPKPKPNFNIRIEMQDGMFEQELRDLDMSNESEGDQAAAQDALMLLASLKDRIEAISTQDL